MDDAQIAQYNEVARRQLAREISPAQAREELGLPPEPEPDSNEDPALPPFLAARRSLAGSAELGREILRHQLGLDEQSVNSLTDDEAVRFAAQSLATPPPVDAAEIEANLRAAHEVTSLVDARPGTLTTIPEDE